MVSEEQVLDALASVRDPELDEAITTLRFVASVEVVDDRVRVALRLPTYFCAPNFAYLMVVDAAEAVRALPGVGRADVVLLDHFASDEINGGFAAALDFADTFPGDAVGSDLAPLRLLFDRKAFIGRQERICRKLLKGGMSHRDLLALSLADLPPSDEVAAYLDRRRALGIDSSPPAAFVVTAGGEPVPESELDDHLRFARATSVSMQANGALCRSLLATRYAIPDPKEVTDEGCEVARLP